MPLSIVTLFKYLRQVLTASDEDWLVVVGNLWKLWKRWSRMARIIEWESAIPRLSGIFFKAVVQVVLLFGLDT